MRRSLSVGLRVSAAGLAALALAIVYPAAPRATSPNVVISQVYGGGGNTGATYKNDFIELYNRGDAPVTLTGWSLQYASSTGTGNFGANTGQLTELPTITLQPGQYYLVQEGSGGAAGIALPTADFTDATPINMSASAGKVALVNVATSLGCNGGSQPCSAAALAKIVDLVGFGNANFYEGTAAAAGPGNNTTAVLRKNGGLTDTDDNKNDFTVAAVTPRTSAATVPTGVATAQPASLEPGATTILRVTVTPGTSPTSTGLSVIADLTSIGGTASQQFYDDGTNGDVTAGDLRFSFATTVAPATALGDTSLPIAVADAQGRSSSTAVALRVFIAPRVAIHEIQGNGTATPFAGQEVVTTGVVTARKASGFFLQVPDAAVDADEQTSEGIYVHTGLLPSVLTGDLVSVRGIATEYHDLTELTGTSVTWLSSGNELPAPVTVTTGLMTVAQGERFEGMRMLTGTLRTVAPSDKFGEVFTVPAELPRPMREIGAPASATLPVDPVTNAVDCCVPRWDENVERIMVDTGELYGASPLFLTSNVTLSGVTGPLDYSFGNYKVLPETAPVASPNIAAVAVPAPAANEFTIAGYNIENFDGDDIQLQKAALNVRTVMRSPDVIGLIEIKNLEALRALAARINADAVAAGEPDPQYEARLMLAPAGGSQNVGFLVKTSRVQIHDVWQHAADEMYQPSDPNRRMGYVHDRPPLVLDATIDPNGANPGRVLVVVNHPRSFIDAELDNSTGVFVREKRTKQAESIAQLLQDLQTQNPGVPVVAVGDYNAYQFSDGYTDPIGIITGNPTPGDRIVYTDSPDLVNPDFVNLTNTLPAAERYSFVFEGTPQAIDHVMINATAQHYFQRYAIAHSNADFPAADTAAGYAQDPTRPEANSDHDQPVAYFAFPGTPVITLTGGATYNHEAFTPFVEPGYAAHDDVHQELPVDVTGSVDVNTPGTYVLTYTATNYYRTTTVTRTVVVADNIAPAIAGFGVTPGNLGAPNHKLVDVEVSFSVSDASGSVACTIGVVSNEPLNGRGDGNTENDVEVVDLHHLRLRAERSGLGTSRIYTITATCTDGSGNAATAIGSVVVSHNSR